MADPVHVRDYALARTSGSNVQTVSLAQVAGEFLILTVFWYQNNSDSCTISDGVDTWHEIPGTYQVSTGSGGGLGLSSCMFYKFATTTATLSTTITAPAGSGSTFTASGGSAFTHINTVQPIGQVNSAKANASGSSPNSGNITTTFAKDVVYGQVYNDNNVGSAGSGFTAASTLFSVYMAQYQLTSSTGTFASTQTGGSVGPFTSAVVEVHGEDFVPKYTLSGNVGVASASATVAYVGTISGTASCDSSGNFSIPNAPAGGYTLTPTLSGYFFFPNAMSRTIAAADISNCQFGAVNPPFNLYAEVAYDSAYVANANPIDPGLWDTGTGFSPLQTLSNTIRATDNGTDISLLDGFGDTGPGAYASMHVVSMVDGSQTGALLMSDIAVAIFYEIFVARSGSNLNLTLGDPSGDIASAVVPYAADTILRVEYVNGVLTGYVNGTSKASASTSASSSGSAGIEIEVVATPDIQIIDFVSGSITYVAPNYTISGNIGDGLGEQVNLTGAQTRSTFADGLGDYSFTGCIVGSYTITPVPPGGDAFTPTKRTPTVSNANVPGQDFTIGPAPPSGGGDFNFLEDYNF